MTIDEAIEYTEERACDKDYAQLANWLRELRRARMEIDLLKTLRDGFRADAQRYKAENAKLRKYAESYAKSVECEGCGWCPYDMDLVCGTETTPMRDGCKLYDELRELGIGVDDE